jgi:NAD(P)-dependent dehydrogenase (short-subunit alcohol dehydrogenase family)
VTGANRGIGQALAAEALARGARRVYAGTRQSLAYPDDRVMPLFLDITRTAQFQAAAKPQLARRAVSNRKARIWPLSSNPSDRPELHQRCCGGTPRAGDR